MQFLLNLYVDEVHIDTHVSYKNAPAKVAFRISLKYIPLNTKLLFPSIFIPSNM